jgi:hypothetical protein
MAILVLLHDDLAEVKCHAHGWHNIPANRWHYDGNAECPTFSPSVRELQGQPGVDQKTRCHFTITKGMIEYHGDNSHEFAGQTLPLLPFSAGEIDRSDWVISQDERKKE